MRDCLVNYQLSGKSRATRGAGFGKWEPLQPAHEPEDSGRQGREQVLQMRLALADGACSAHASGAGGLGEGAFHAAARLIHLAECGRLLPGPSAQEQLMAFWGKAERHAASGRSRFGAPGALWTGLAGGLGKPDRHDGLALGILAVMPRDAVLALWTGHHLVLPVDGELGDIEGTFGVCACQLGVTRRNGQNRTLRFQKSGERPAVRPLASSQFRSVPPAGHRAGTYPTSRLALPPGQGGASSHVR